MIRGANAICCECALKLGVVEPFTRGVGQCLRCPGCGVQLIVRRVPEGWEVRTMTEHKLQRVKPLPAVADTRMAASIARRIVDALRLLGRVEPGEASLQASAEERAP